MSETTYKKLDENNLEETTTATRNLTKEALEKTKAFHQAKIDEIDNLLDLLK